jgi:hypothetical protein
MTHDPSDPPPPPRIRPQSTVLLRPQAAFVRDVVRGCWWPWGRRRRRIAEKTHMCVCVCVPLYRFVSAVQRRHALYRPLGVRDAACRLSTDGLTRHVGSKHDAAYRLAVDSLTTAERAVRAITAWQAAITRVRAITGGGCGDGGGSSDDDLVALSSVVSLRCPLGGTRINEPARYAQCKHLACFDLGNFLDVNSRARKWTCPVCQHAAHPEGLVTDAYLAHVISQLPALDDPFDDDNNITEVEVRPDGMDTHGTHVPPLRA